jgi:hypothetical protein
MRNASPDAQAQRNGSVAHVLLGGCWQTRMMRSLICCRGLIAGALTLTQRDTK